MSGSTVRFAQVKSYPSFLLRRADVDFEQVAGRIVRNPATAAGELYMYGRMIVEDGDIMDLVRLLTANDKWEKGQNNLEPSWLVRSVGSVKHRVDQLTREDAVSLERRPFALEGVGRIGARGRQLLEVVVVGCAEARGQLQTFGVAQSASGRDGHASQK